MPSLLKDITRVNGFWKIDTMVHANEDPLVLAIIVIQSTNKLFVLTFYHTVLTFNDPEIEAF